MLGTPWEVSPSQPAPSPSPSSAPTPPPLPSSSAWQPLVLVSKADMRAWSRARRAEGKRVGFVPTMGSLHAGHLSLVEAARRARCDAVVVSIYVNPTQFAAGEDFDVYPRDAEGDLAACAAANVDAVWMPRDLYDYGQGGDDCGAVTPGSDDPVAHGTTVSVARLSRGLCARGRPHHFDGVSTVVAKLFNVVEPDVAVLGKKDYQQLCVVRRMVRDLDMAIEVLGGEHVRDADGLALSSRNARLSADDRRRAACIPTALFAARDSYAGGRGETSAATLCGAVEAAIRAGGGEVDYVLLCHPAHLTEMDAVDAADGGVIAVAATFGGVRLLDNVELAPAAGSPGGAE